MILNDIIQNDERKNLNDNINYKTKYLTTIENYETKF